MAKSKRELGGRKSRSGLQPNEFNFFGESKVVCPFTRKTASVEGHERTGIGNNSYEKPTQ